MNYQMEHTRMVYINPITNEYVPGITDVAAGVHE